MSFVISYVFCKKDNLEDFIKFLISIKKYPPNHSAVLVVTIKEVTNSVERKMIQIIRNMRLETNVRVHRFPEIGYDLGIHCLINKIYNPEVIIFMTATSQVNHKHWFELLVNPIKNNNAGFVGSMYSIVSIKSDYYLNAETRIRNKLCLKLSNSQLINFDYLNLGKRKIYFNFGKFHENIASVVVKVVFWFYKLKHPIGYKMFFPAFPNPHIRTTGCAIKSSLLDRIGVFPNSKEHVLISESGYSNLSAEAKRLGYEVLVYTTSGGYRNIFNKEIEYTYTFVKTKSIVIDHHILKFPQLSKLRRTAFNDLLARHDSGTLAKLRDYEPKV